MTSSLSFEATKGSFDLIPVIDIERTTKGYPKTSSKWRAMVKRWVELCEDHYGVQPVIYSSLGVYFKNRFDRLGCKFWYGNVNSNSTILEKVNYVLWQREIKPVVGIAGEIDCDYLAPDCTISDIMMK